VVNSDIEAERDHLRVGDHIVRVLTMKEAITETRPLVLDALLKISANFYVVTEWTPLPADKARKEVNKRRRHFNMSKTGFVSQMSNDATQTNPRDVLVDESKQADIENLWDCLRALGDGQSLVDFSLTIVLYGRASSGQARTELDQLVAEFTGVFTNADGNLFAETYNQLNAYFATVPGNYALNLRKLYLLNTNYTDLSFLFTILPGEKTNAHLGTEYLAALETDNSTPAQQASTKGQPPQPTLQDNTDSNVQELKNQIQAERQKERQATMAAAAMGDPALASATPAQRTAAARYGQNGVAAPRVPGQPCSQLQQGDTQGQLTPTQQQAQLIAAKERERVDNSRFASNLVYSGSAVQPQQREQGQAMPSMGPPTGSQTVVSSRQNLRQNAKIHLEAISARLRPMSIQLPASRI
jgi:hypothetical protein